MNFALRRTILLLAVAVLAVSLMGVAGCTRAPKLTMEQLAAGQIPPKHPVDQATAQAKGCSCHTQQ